MKISNAKSWWPWGCLMICFGGLGRRIEKFEKGAYCTERKLF